MGAVLPPWLILVTSFAYIGLLFAIAYWGDRRADTGRSVVGHPAIYALSIAVYCTSWTFYGSVGRAASSGIGFLPIYLGPTLMFVLGWFVLRKVLRIGKVHNITSIADFISSRYGKSHLLGGLVTVIAVVGIMPYISLQLQGIAGSFEVLVGPHVVMLAGQSVFADTAFYVALFLAAFSILFGTRHIDATEQHAGMVAAIAFESVVKLLAFLAVGVFVTWGIFDGPLDIFARAAEKPALARLFSADAVATSQWVTLTGLAMVAIVCLPRQFQVVVVENTDEKALDTATWAFPAYLFAINLFVLPIALGGLLSFPGGTVNGDTFVLALPMQADAPWLALFGFLGGLSAATGMVIVATIALSTMISNDLIMPLLLRFAWLHLAERQDLSGLLLGIRRAAIVLILLLGYGYFRLIGESYTLVTIGLMSFAAAAQFAPAIFGGLYWRGATWLGAVWGLTGGFLVWLYCLLLPSFARSGWLPLDFITSGPLGIELLRPYALFGLDGFDPVTHAMVWSVIVNLGLYVGISLFVRQSPLERTQATLFVEVYRQSGGEAGGLWRGEARVDDLRNLANRFIGQDRADAAFAQYAQRRNLDLERLKEADGAMVKFTERLLAGAMGGASARVLVASVVKAEGVTPEEMAELLDEATQVIEYSRELEQKSIALERAHRELQEANEQLKEVDRLKDEFLSTVTHELRTPLTSIRSFSEILHDTPSLAGEQRQHFLEIIIKESERLTRLINNVLDLAKIESGRMEWNVEDVDLAAVARDSVATLAQLLKERGIEVHLKIDPALGPVRGDRDRLMQVVINLLSNAQKAYEKYDRGAVTVSVQTASGGREAIVTVADQGPGIPYEDQPRVFDRFYQSSVVGTGNPTGSGLGLAISRRIVEHLGGRIWLESTPGVGATFGFTVPLTPRRVPAA